MTKWVRVALNVLAAVAAIQASADPKVEVFTPQGESKGVRQVAVRFGDPMVDFGDPRLSDPFTWQCEGDPRAVKGKGRWADARNWVFDFDADLPAGVRCRFALEPDLKSASLAPLAGPRGFEFNTGGPTVVASLPREGHTAIDEDQTFVLMFDAPVDPASLADAWCEAKGVNERIPVQALGSDEARKVLAAQPQAAYRFYRLVLKGRKPVDLARFRIEDTRWRTLPILGARCSRRLPAGGEMSLVIGEGVKTRSGIARGTAQRLAFGVRPDFSAALHCQRVNKDAQCMPTSAMRLDFTAPVARQIAARVRLQPARGKARPAVLDPDVKTVDGVRFEGPFPESAQFSVEVPADLRDDAGRALSNAASFPLAVRTDRYPALLKFPARFGILEASDPMLPVTVRGIEPDLKGSEVAVSTAPIPGATTRIEGEGQIVRRLMAFLTPPDERARKGKAVKPGELPSIEAGDEAKPLSIPRPLKGRATEVIGIPLGKPGFYLVELASPRLGAELHGEKGKPYYVATSALVTNLAVHLKHGRESSLIWVTHLSDATPVADARVSLRDCHGGLLYEGRTGEDGVASIDKEIPAVRGYPPCPHIAFAEEGDDLSFTLSTWREGIEPWNFGMNVGYWSAKNLTIHTIFDRALFRAGEKVSMKHVARVPVGVGFRTPKPGEAPAKLTLIHVGSDQKVELPVRFDAHGIAESTWTIPKEAKLGTYELSWERNGVAIRAEAQFRVEAFRVPLMRATLAAPAAPLVRPKSTQIDAAVTYLAGGPAGAIPVTVRHRVEPREASFEDYPEFQFGGDAVKEGVQTGSAADAFSLYDPDEEETPAEGGAGSGESTVATRKATLDANGTASLRIDNLPPIERPASLVVEMEYSDPNGEHLSTATRVALHPASLYVGIKVDSWAASKSGVDAQVIVLDTSGKPLADRPVAVDIFERKSYSSRRRVLGGFYAYDTVTETRKVGEGCGGRTDGKGLVHCAVKPGASGELVLRAQALDDAKLASAATASVWVAGDGEWWFDPASNDRIDLIAEKRRYEPGETARFQVRMPFRKATVLVTVEREGVLSHRIVELDARSPVIEVPVLASYGPNVYVSALAVRGRIAGKGAKPPTALLDLAKPAYKLGEASIKVGRRGYELTVKVSPDRDTFKVREKAHVAIEVSDADGKPAANGEVALAAVDEGLLELMDNKSWDILEGMLGERPLEVTTATAQGHVVGKRHYGRKSVPAGGGGGKSGARELFDTLLLWKGRVPLDARGRASVEIPLNDSLSSFRIVAVALQGDAKFGTGRATIRTTQDLMVLAGLPPVVREGDAFSAMFTLRNATAAAIDARFAWSVRDGPGLKGKAIAQGEEPVRLAGGESRLVSVPVTVPVNMAKLYWEVNATSAGARDTLHATQDVVEVHPVRVYQASLARLDQPITLPVDRPADSIPGRGGVRVEIMGSLAGELSPLREWFRYYPYSCLEQRASKAIGLRDAAMFAAVGASLPNYLDRDGLARYFPSDSLEGSDVLTTYLVQIADADGREWPEEARNRMLDGLDAFVTGRITRGSALPTADLAIRKLAAIEALSRHERARPGMLDTIAIDPPRWPTSALVDWIGILQRVEGIPGREARREQALSILRSRMNFQGTVMTFSSERSDALWWLMVSGDANANRALLAVLPEASWREDIGRVVRGALSRQVRGTWSTTVANAWGTVALARYSQAFESTPVSGSTRVTLAGEREDVEVAAAKKTLDLAWPGSRATLSLAHQGEGAPWAIVQSRAALPLKEALSTGYRVTRTVKPVEQKDAPGYSRGDVYRVTLEIEAQSDMTWVVVDDPVPSGAAILGSGLARDSALLTRGERSLGWAWPAFIERTFTSYRAYYELVPKGKFTVEYTVRLNNPGRFDLPATRVEAMYAPEMLGEVPNAPVSVKP
ncbi:MAG TPA: MG2 domain-containing protein [Usitatibacter sp.]|nr:MG2 domain-containing protein [Usitatibacter sp.]